MKILMTGAGGQIGSDLITALVAQGHSIVATDLKPRPSTPEVAWRGLDVVEGAAVDRIIAEEAPEVVYHLAAILSATGEKNPALGYAVNYTPEGLVGTQVAAVVNFPTRQIGPLMSEVLTVGFADENDFVTLFRPTKKVPNGGRLY